MFSNSRYQGYLKVYTFHLNIFTIRLKSEIDMICGYIFVFNSSEKDTKFIRHEQIH
ncbi:hypothetical protein EV200_106135 [Pedobacter psychrotolerans]|uniref:Uncharacterized protein n=1 Tax=Pedobacter psychrotolerans TaxID=1843235 RepID=A0A4R2H7W8_9SPHI|nr:hypothetical protein EV200_106135 [Pedobacter psychrotolerans]